MPGIKHTLKLPDNARSQPDKFRDAARELECDEDEAAFEGQVKKIVEAPRSEPVKPE